MNDKPTRRVAARAYPAGDGETDTISEAELAAGFAATSVRLSPITTLASLAAAIVFVAGAWVNDISLAVTLPWLGAMLLVLGARLWLDRAILTEPKRLAAAWRNLATVQQGLHGVLWGAAVWLPSSGVDTGWPELPVLLSLVPVIGVAVGHAALPRAALAFLLPYMVSLTVFFGSAGQGHRAFLFLAAMLLPLVAGIYLHRWIRETVRLRLANERLLERARLDHESAEHSARYLTEILNTLEFGIAVFDRDLNVCAWNDTIVNMRLFPGDILRVGIPVADLVRANAERGLYNSEEAPDALTRRVHGFLQAAYRKGDSGSGIDLADGRRIKLQSSVMPNGHMVMSTADVTAHRDEMKDTIWHITHHCDLTGLFNRLSLKPSLEVMFTGLSRPSERMAVLELDIHRFREINSAMGPEVGDSVLRIIAERLRQNAGQGDVVARISGDEFVMGMGGLATLEEAAERADLILHALRAPISVEGRIVNATMHAGMAVYPDHAATVDQLLSKASLAHKAVKGNEQRSWAFYDESIAGQAEEQALLRSEIRRALNEREFMLYFQPQIDLATSRVLGAETLIRWHHPEHGWISPGKFIPVAESSRLIVELTEWILPEACREAKRWIGLGWTDFVVAVNISPVHFRTEGLVDLVRESLIETGLPARNLELELTEGMILPDDEHVANILKHLGELGIRLAIDDFGTGYSAMSYLKTFPFQKLKIDLSFIRDLSPEPQTQSIVEAITQVGHTLGHYVIAEGVETAEQAEILEKIGCDGVQGFLHSPALPAEKFISWVDAYETEDTAAPAQRARG